MEQKAINYNEVRGNKIKDVIIYLTSNCQLSCKHCYLPDENNIKQLSLQDLDWFTKTFEVKRANLMGGEPFLYPYLKEAVQLFEKVTITTNGIILSLDNDRRKELINVLKSKGKDLSIQLSIQGNQEDTDFIRGPGVWQKVMSAANFLKKNEIPCFFMSNYSQKNLDHIPWVIDNISNPLHMPLTLSPEIGEPPLSIEEQNWLFSTIVKKNNDYKGQNLIDQPNFYQWLGLPGRCGAGSERLSITYNKEIVPCHLDFTYYLGKIGTPLSIINQSRELFLKTKNHINSDCLFCSKSNICRSGCYISSSSQGCPLKGNYTIERYAYVNSMDSETFSKQVSNIKGFLKDSIICI